MLLPGQVENWIVLIDLGKKGLGNLSVNSLKQVLGLLQANYRCRLGMSYITNPPKSIWMLWSCIKPFLDEATIAKIKISNSAYSPEMLESFNPSQVEEKYGGKACNALNYWPPIVPEQSFYVPGQEVFQSNKDSYKLHYPGEEPAEALVENCDSSRPLQRNRVSSMDVDLDHSDVSLEDLGDKGFARSDDEENGENLVELEAFSPFNKSGEKSPAMMKAGMRGIDELVLRSCKKVIGRESDDRNNDDDLTQALSSPNKGEGHSSLGFHEFETPKKKGPKPIGIIIETDDSWSRCSKGACCQTIQGNCIIS